MIFIVTVISVFEDYYKNVKTNQIKAIFSRVLANTKNTFLRI